MIHYKMDSRLVQFFIRHSSTMISDCWLMRQFWIMCRVTGLTAHPIHHDHLRQRRGMATTAKFLLIAGIVFTGSAIAPHQFSRSPHMGLTIGSAAAAQTPIPPISNEEIRNYAAAILAMEPLRQSAYTEVTRIIGTGNVPQITCNRRQDLNNLPVTIRGIATNFCDQSKRIVEDNGLSISRFNDITISLNDNPSLQQRVQTELIRLQNQPPSPK